MSDNPHPLTIDTTTASDNNGPHVVTPHDADMPHPLARSEATSERSIATSSTQQECVKLVETLQAQGCQQLWQIQEYEHLSNAGWWSGTDNNEKKEREREEKIESRKLTGV